MRPGISDILCHREYVSPSLGLLTILFWAYERFVLVQPRVFNSLAHDLYARTQLEDAIYLSSRRVIAKYSDRTPLPAVAISADWITSLRPNKAVSVTTDFNLINRHHPQVNRIFWQIFEPYDLPC
jgi:hypothetical protein